MHVHRHTSKLGLHGFSFGLISFDRVRIPPQNILGEVGQGFDIAQSSSVLYGRPNLAAVSLGLHEAAVALTTQHVSNRPRYKGAVADLGVVRDRLGRMSARAIMARILAYHAVDMLDRGQPCDMELIAAKAIGHELAAEAGRDAMELHGANALTEDYPLERIWRDMQTTYAPMRHRRSPAHPPRPEPPPRTPPPRRGDRPHAVVHPPRPPHTARPSRPGARPVKSPRARQPPYIRIAVRGPQPRRRPRIQARPAAGRTPPHPSPHTRPYPSLPSQRNA